MSTRTDLIYPEINVPNPVTFLDRLEAEVEQSADWRAAKNHAECRAVVAEFIGQGFDGKGLGISAYVDDTFLDDPTPNTIMFAVLADRWGEDETGFRRITDAEIKSAFALSSGPSFVALQYCCSFRVGFGIRQGAGVGRYQRKPYSA